MTTTTLKTVATVIAMVVPSRGSIILFVVTFLMIICPWEVKSLILSPSLDALRASLSTSAPRILVSEADNDDEVNRPSRCPKQLQTRREFWDRTATTTNSGACGVLWTMLAVTSASAGRRPAFADSSSAPLALLSRDVDVGGGFDLMNPRRPLRARDVYYPQSMEGRWIVRRTVVKIDGDNFQASEAFRCLGYGGGGGKLYDGMVETFDAMFVKPSATFNTNELERFVVADRGFETRSRSNSFNDENQVEWSVDDPNTLKVGKSIRIEVVDRSVELPTDQGFGFDELLRIDDGMIIRAAQVKRRYRRSFDENGNRVVEGIELVKTFRVLDGIAGTEFPTSTVKSQLTLTRPRGETRYGLSAV